MEQPVGLYITNSRLEVNLELWTTQAALRKRFNLKKNYISENVKRGLIPCYRVKELNLVLVPNYLTIKELQAGIENSKKKL